MQLFPNNKNFLCISSLRTTLSRQQAAALPTALHVVKLKTNQKNIVRGQTASDWSLVGDSGPIQTAAAGFGRSADHWSLTGGFVFSRDNRRWGVGVSNSYTPPPHCTLLHL